ncbi:DUF6318 family protein [Cellulomonas sp.]|uniref:DUF6318 family protein n=1 Tax=Cellulomonas sp. TaxID=40001 RepID=UPI001B258A61|nr:DUF6318 family protein [Cellulomonas sp.]MBO9554948.1 hypothetical protein [Cellulomonas sp.]
MLLRRHLVAPLAVALLTATLAACTGSAPADPTTAPTTSASAPADEATPSTAATPEASATPTDESSPAAPAALKQPASAEGAQDVSRYFMELYPYVLRTGDVEPWTTLSSPDCTTCSAVTEGAADPDPTSKQAVDIRSVTATEDSPGSFSVSMDMYETPRVAPDVVHFAVTLSLVHDGTAWHVTAVRPTRLES